MQAIDRFGRHDHVELAERDSGKLVYARKGFIDFEVRGAIDQTLGRLVKAALGKRADKPRVPENRESAPLPPMGSGP